MSNTFADKSAAERLQIWDSLDEEEKRKLAADLGLTDEMRKIFQDIIKKAAMDAHAAIERNAELAYVLMPSPATKAYITGQTISALCRALQEMLLEQGAPIPVIKRLTNIKELL